MYAIMEQNSSTMDIYERHNHACMIVRTARFDHHTIRGRKRKMSRKSGFIQEFKKFILRGNVMDMAVGVIVGGAFGKITSSLVNDVFMPFLGWVIGDIDLTALNITLSPAVMEGDTVVKEAVVVGIGSFLATIIDFLLIALVVFLFVKAVNTARSKLEKPAEEEAPAAPPEPSNEEKLLAEIRDLLKNR